MAQLVTTLAIASQTLTYNQTVTSLTPVIASGGTGTITFSISPTLPGGLTFNSQTGTISGISSQLRNESVYYITVADQSGQTRTNSFSLEVKAPLFEIVQTTNNKILIVTETLDPVVLVTVLGGFGTITYSISPALPAGLYFNNNTGELSGIPTELLENTRYTVTIKDSLDQTLTQEFSLSVVRSNYSTDATIPIWLTPPGLLFTATELVGASAVLVASGENIHYELISGSLPSGLEIASNGVIAGIPSSIITGVPTGVLEKTRSNFVVRAKSAQGTRVADRTFYIDVEGPDDPIWKTSSGFLPIGIQGEQYALNNQWVDYSLSAIPNTAPDNTEIIYYIADGDGKLPPGLSLDQAGRITGFIRDQLTFVDDIDAGTGYDTESYDARSYDHALRFIGSLTDTTIVGLPKIYQFRVTATDRVSSAKRLFKIVVTSVGILQYNTTSMPTDVYVPTDTVFIQYPQWVNGSDLGTIRASNNQILNVTAYDGDPFSGTITYAIINGSSVEQQLPEGLSLSTNTGYISGFVPYQPAYTRNYQLNIAATKRLTGTTSSVTVTNVFSLAVKGNVESSIQWVTASDLGTIETGLVSELAVRAIQLNSEYNIKYQLVGGELPPGLQLVSDGSLAGQVNHNISGPFSFTVMATDVYELSSIERTFTLRVNQYTEKEYTRIWVRPFMSMEKRSRYGEFISDTFIFEPRFIYRPLDSNFGIQSEIKMMLEFGIEQLDIRDYVPALQENFYRKNLYFGDVKMAIARDSKKNIVYEVVYVDIVDNLVNNQGTSVNQVVYYPDKFFYPNSVDNMRHRLETIVLPDKSYIGVNYDSLPRFMNTPQGTEYRATEYIKVVPLCYALPGQGSRIISRIKLSGFDFKLLDFEVDRIVIQNAKDSATAKYLIFGRQDISQTLPTDINLKGPDEFVLTDENGNPIF